MKANRRLAIRTPRRSMAAALMLACGLFVGSSNAQWVVTDPGHTAGTFADMAQSWGEFLEQARRWQRTIQEYQDALTTLTSVMDNPTGMLAGFTNDMTKVPNDYGDNLNCRKPPGSGDLSLSTLFSILLPDANKNIASQQYSLCLQANHLRNMKYNEMVDMVAEAKKCSNDVNELIARAKASQTEGNWRAAMLNGQVLIGRSQAQMEYMKARLDAYDTMIAKTEQTSNSLAEKAMNGGDSSLIGSIAGTAVSAATLKAALDSIH